MRLRILLPACLWVLLAFVAAGALAGGQNPPPAAPGEQNPTAQPNAQAGAPPALVKIDPRAQALLDRVIQALGGQAFLNFKTLTTRGRTFAVSNDKTAGMAPYQSWVEFPDKRRFSYGKDHPVILVNNGEKDWELDQMGMTSQLPEQVWRWKLTTKYGFENLLRLRVREPGILIQLGGTDFVDNVPTQSIDITESGGARVRIDLNRQTNLPVRVSYRAQDPNSHEWVEYGDVYADYQDIQGIRTPMHITRWVNGERVGEVFRNAAKYDETYPASYFQP